MKSGRESGSARRVTCMRVPEKGVFCRDAVGERGVSDVDCSSPVVGGRGLAGVRGSHGPAGEAGRAVDDTVVGRESGAPSGGIGDVEPRRSGCRGVTGTLALPAPATLVPAEGRALGTPTSSPLREEIGGIVRLERFGSGVEEGSLVPVVTPFVMTCPPELSSIVVLGWCQDPSRR